MIDLQAMNDQTADWRERLVNSNVSAASREGPGIANLTAGRSVERRAIQNDFAFIVFLQLFHFFVPANQGK